MDPKKTAAERCERRGGSRVAWLAALVSLLWVSVSAAPSVASEVRVERLPDGTVLIVGDGSRGTRRPPRTAPSRRLPPAALSALIDRHSREQSLEPRLVEAIIQAESDYDPRALSVKGAIGLMQLMPGTARDLGVEDPWDPDQNIGGGTRYLRFLLDRFGGDLERALAGYNAGPSAVERHGGIPPYAETTHYVDKVLGLYRGRRVRSSRPIASRPAPSAYRPVRVTRASDGTLLLVTPD